MKKAISAFAIITLIGVLCAGCAAESPDVSTSPDSETLRVTETSTPDESSQATNELILSDSSQNNDTPQQSEVPEVNAPTAQDKDQEQQPEKTSSAPKASDTPAKAEEPTEKPQKTEKSETAATKAPQTPAAKEPQETAAMATPKPTPKPTPEPTPTPEPEPEMEIMSGSFNSAVLTAVNAARAEYGNAPMALDSGLCAKALAHAKEMAERGEIFHSCGGAESVSNAAGSGSTIGTRSAAHATGLALDADRSRLGVGSVKIGDKQYTCVFSPRD